MQPDVAGPAVEEIAHHRVVVAADRDPVFAARAAGEQEREHAPGIGPAVAEIAHMHHRRFGVVHAHPVRADQPVDLFQLVAVAVDIADGIAPHARIPPAVA